MALGSNSASTIACGGNFTLVLTTRMSVLACGDQTIATANPETLSVSVTNIA
eukprot:CAMPEP_0194157270 /NCGR_PEP_ID=MMETSP0152-20130528/71328_1 /TAXON_ID=1049557 /ORGANISM="Thalassiothrix antarctica, Strain L6-D1" /LENGTH=51 /DNA_ID=CAMNT_0038865529 /DNA_START=127 /DNA_END=279 /DNA_ORIENTATION=-